nr:MAG TPA: hypothetical protein [Caudoviricetes sp.]DAL07543.1 MAG TPA: hypothetical protein [Caudoviricetes sp.]
MRFLQNGYKNNSHARVVFITLQNNMNVLQ